MKQVRIESLDQLADLYESGQITTKQLYKIIEASKISLITFDDDANEMETPEYKKDILQGFRKYIECIKIGAERPLFLMAGENNLDIYSKAINEHKKENK